MLADLPGLHRTMEVMPVVQAMELAPSVDIDLPPIAASAIIPVSEKDLTNRNLNQLAKAGYSSGKFRRGTMWDTCPLALTFGNHLLRSHPDHDKPKAKHCQTDLAH